MKIKFTGNAHSITQDKVYEVIGIECGSYRIINDSNDPCLYEPEKCEIIEHTEPEFWVKEKGENGELYAYPLSWLASGFFEDYHDKVETVVTQFWKECKKYYGISKNV